MCGRERAGKCVGERVICKLVVLSGGRECSVQLAFSCCQSLSITTATAFVTVSRGRDAAYSQ